MRRTSRIIAGSVFGLCFSGLSALADGPSDPVVTPPVIAPAPDTGGEWGGFYSGLNLGAADLSTATGASGNDTTYGVHLGYDFDLGRLVLGGELEYDETDVDLGAATVDNVARLKLRGGYDLGRTLVYATAGTARADTSLGSDTGGFAGVGVTYQINDRFRLGGELLEHRFNDVGGSGVDVDATTFNLRAQFRF